MRHRVFPSCYSTSYASSPVAPWLDAFSTTADDTEMGTKRGAAIAGGRVPSYRDTLRLFLPFVAKGTGRPISRLQLAELSLEQVLGFLRHMEEDRHNSVATRNQRLAALRTCLRVSRSAQPRGSSPVRTGRGDSQQTHANARHPVHFTGRRAGAILSFTQLGQARASRPSFAAVPLQHRCPSPGGLGPAHCTPDVGAATLRAIAREGRQVAGVPPLAGDRRAACFCSSVDAYRSPTAPNLYPVRDDRSRALGFTNGYAASPSM